MADGADFRALFGNQSVVPMLYADLLPRQSRLELALRVLAFGVLAGLGVVSNIICLIILVRSKLYKNWTYVMLMNLSATDLLLCVNNLVLFLPGVIMDSFPFPLAICNMRQILTFAPMYVSVMTFLLTALQRYLAIVYNKGKLWLFTVPSVAVSLPFMWLLAVCLAVPANYPGQYIAYVWRDICAMTSDSIMLSVQYINSILIVIPLTVVLIMYVHIYWAVRKSSTRVQGQTGGKAISKHHKHMAKVLFILYVAAFVVFMPYVALSYLNSSNQSVTVFRLYILLGSNMLTLVSAANPLLFAVLFKPIKKHCLKMLGAKDADNNTVTQMTQSVNY